MIPLFRSIVAALCVAGWLSAWAAKPPLPQPREWIGLEGGWRFEIDSAGVGEQERWFDHTLRHMINLPGSMTENGYGDPITVDTKWTGSIIDRSWFADPKFEKYRQPGNVKVPFWLQPEHYYVGAAWYQRDVNVPNSWIGRRILLFLERAHWQTRVWVDGQEAGDNDSLSTPHVYDLSSWLSPGEHHLTVRVDNRVRVNVGQDAHSVSDHTQGNWNGIVGRLELRTEPLFALSEIQVFPDIAQHSARVRVTLGNPTGARALAELHLKAETANTKVRKQLDQKIVPLEIGADGMVAEILYPMGDSPMLWDEFSPTLYHLSVGLRSEKGGTNLFDERVITFGMRQLGQQGTQFTMNGRKIFLRGTLECCIFPLTGFPPTDTNSWKYIIAVCRAHGLNHIRFHSWCPPDAAFQAADELGFYFHVECDAWANVDDGVFREFLDRESHRILTEYGNHPSFCFMAYGNEPGGERQARFLGDTVNKWRAEDPRRKYTSAAGWPSIPENDYHVTPTPRIQAWGGGLNSRINAKPPETVTDYRDFIAKHTVPVVSHEIGQWCAYPPLRDISKYTGVMKARNFEIFRDDLTAHHMMDQADAFLMASGKLQALCYKEEIESALRTPGMGGFELLDLHDFPGQGTALVGVLDSFWDSKGYISPDEFRRFSGPTVPLALLPKRVFVAGETLDATLRIAHFGPAPLLNARVLWNLADEDGHLLGSGALPPQTIPIGNDTTLGQIQAPLARQLDAHKMTLGVGLAGTAFTNQWDLWVYPSQVTTAAPPSTLLTSSLDDAAVQRLQSGGEVLLMVGNNQARGDRLGRVEVGFSSIFWNTAWTKRQPPHTLGILCAPRHPALRAFPTDYHTNWQWWYILSHSSALILDDLPEKLRPIVQIIDDWVTNRRLGLVVEAKVEGGKLLICSADLNADLDHNPVARQLLHSLLHYMDTPAFNPSVDLRADQVRSLMVQP